MWSMVRWPMQRDCVAHGTRGGGVRATSGGRTFSAPSRRLPELGALRPLPAGPLRTSRPSWCWLEAGHADDRLGQPDVAGRALELRVPEGEDAAVGRHEP